MSIKIDTGIVGTSKLVMIRQGTITDLSEHTMRVSLDPPEKCSKCSKGMGCGAGLFGSLFSSRRSDICISRLPQCRTGDRLSLEIPSSVALKMAFTGYCVPVLSMMLCAMICQYLVSSHPVLVAASGFLGLFGGLVGGLIAYPGLSTHVSARSGKAIRIVQINKLQFQLPSL